MPSVPPVNPTLLIPLLHALRRGATLAELSAATGGRSRATVYRDLATLRSAGMRIECRRGRYTVSDWGVFDEERLDVPVNYPALKGGACGDAGLVDQGKR